MGVQRVKILGFQDGRFCCFGEGTDATIKRGFPRILLDTDVTATWWIEFCNDIDYRLKAIRPIKLEKSRKSIILYLLLMVMIMCTPIVIFETPMEKSIGTVWHFVIFGLVYIIPFVTFLYINRALTRKMNVVYDELKVLCSNASETFANVAFKFKVVSRTDGQTCWSVRFIEVIVTGIGIDGDDNSTASISEESFSDEDNDMNEDLDV